MSNFKAREHQQFAREHQHSCDYLFLDILGKCNKYMQDIVISMGINEDGHTSKIEVQLVLKSYL